MCFDIGVDFEHLEGDSKLPKIQSLLLHLARRGELDELLNMLNEERPDIDWPALPAGFNVDRSSDDLPAEKGGVTLGNVGAHAAVAIGDGAAVNVQNTQVQNYDFSGTITGNVNIAGDVHLDAADLPIPAPPPTELPPSIDHFIGRRSELKKYQDQLANAQIAVISGMPGMGKTLLAAAVAQRVSSPENIFWHTFRPGEGIDTVVWQLAAFLAHRRLDDLWQTLQRARLTRGAPPPAETVINHLVELLRARELLLVLDDIHHINDDPQLNLFIERTRRSVLAGDFKIILTSRELPDFITLVETAYIEGLTIDDVSLLLNQQKIELPAGLINRLYERTNGNPELVMLSIELLRDNPQPERLIDNLDEARSVEKFILKEVDDRLAEDEPAVMNAVSIIDSLGNRGTRYAIGAVLEGQNVRRIVRDLADRFLLLSQTGAEGEEYGQHAMVREFYYDGLSRRQRQALHRLAGIYYRDKEMQPLRAAGHFLRSGALEEAAQLITGDIWEFVNQGQSRALLAILTRLAAETLPPSLERQIKLALGEVTAYLGESASAQEAFEAVINQLSHEASAPAERQDLVRAYLGIGELLAQNNPEEALEWLNRGIELEKQGIRLDPHTASGLYLKTGTIYMWMGDYSQAQTYLEQASERLPEGPSQMRSRVLATLGAVVFEHERDIKRALALTDEALDLCRFLHDYFYLGSILSNRGSFRFESGDWSGAVEDFREGLALAQKLNSDRAQAITSFSLGKAMVLVGDYSAALKYLTRAQELAEETDQLFLKNIILLTLADLSLRKENWNKAADLLAQAEKLTDQLDDEPARPTIKQGLAQLELSRGNIQAASLLAREALELSRAGNDPTEIGISLRVLAQIYERQENFEAAASAFEESVHLLVNDPYENARTMLLLGSFLMQKGDTTSAQEFLSEAREIFEKLGAKPELVSFEN